MIRNDRAHVYIAAATHPGMRGKNNEDRFSVSAYRLAPDDPTPAVFAIISDGIGGHRAGEVAAEMAVEKISHDVAQSDAGRPVDILRQAISRASREIREQAQRNSGQKGMGATCVCAWIIADRLYAAAVGDSRLYLMRGDRIIQLTTDHTWVQEAIEFGALTPEQARIHPNAHVIRRHLGSQNPVVPDFRLKLAPDQSAEQAEANQGLRLLPGDRLLMCSDGLTDLVDDDEILAAFKTQERSEALNSLIDLANQRGGHDNITIITLEIPVGRPETRRLIVRDQLPALPRRRWPYALTCLLAAITLLVVTALVAGAFFAMGYLRRPTVVPTATRQATPTRLLSPSAGVTLTPSSTPPAPLISPPVQLTSAAPTAPVETLPLVTLPPPFTPQLTDIPINPPRP